MTLLDLIKSQKENEEKYNFVIYFKDYDVINTSVKITFKQLMSIVGLSIQDKKIEYKKGNYNVILLEIKDS